LVFTVKTPELDMEKTITLLDNNGQNVVGRVFKEPGDTMMSKTRFTVPLAGNDTTLFILQPNITNLDLISQANFEARGYAEISLSSVSTPTATQILVTPEHRGTFFGDLGSNSGGDGDCQLGEVAYALPTANGGSLFELIRAS
jgi:hypothetical protein